MASTGQIAPTSASTYGPGDYPWSNVNNVLLDDAGRATAGIDPGFFSDFIVVRFVFSAFPSGSTIDGLTLQTNIRDFGASLSKDSNVQLSKASGSAAGSNLASATNYTSSYVTRTYGSATELWGQTWTAAELEAGSCYAHISCQDEALGTGAIIHLQYVSLAADYTIASVSGSNPNRRHRIIVRGFPVIGNKPRGCISRCK